MYGNKGNVMKNMLIASMTFILFASYAHAVSPSSKDDVQSFVEKQMVQGDVQEDIESLLSESLTEEAVVRIVLLNSPSIKAHLASIGISEAERREAGLLKNPTVTFSSRKSNEEDSKRNNEIEIKQDVMDVFFWPLRKKVAGTRFKAAKYEAAEAISKIIEEARLSYLEWLAAIHKRQLSKDHLKAQEAALEISRGQKEAGNINALQVAGAETAAQRAKIEWLKTEENVQALSQKLRTVLGLKPDQFFLDKPAKIPLLPQENLSLSELESKVLDRRLDISMKRQEIKALEQSVNLASLGVLPEVEVGYNQENEPSGEKLKGIVVEGQAPLFNRNQAGRMGIKASIETAKLQLQSMEQQALLEVRLAYQSLVTRRQVAEAYQTMLPNYQKMVKETLYEYNFMLKDVFHLLEARQEELKTQEEYVDALKDYWAARAELEQAYGARFPFEAVTEPKKDQPKEKTAHEHNHGG
jgi:outer membrane protein, heavy metal efflux system